jgi:hypothetical protein
MRRRAVRKRRIEESEREKRDREGVTLLLPVASTFLSES